MAAQATDQKKEEVDNVPLLLKHFSDEIQKIIPDEQEVTLGSLPLIGAIFFDSREEETVVVQQYTAVMRKYHNVVAMAAAARKMILPSSGSSSSGSSSSSSSSGSSSSGCSSSGNNHLTRWRGGGRAWGESNNMSL